MAKTQQPQILSLKLLAWYDSQGRELPWRVKGRESADPYRVWLSEIMLQQTTVAAVKAYFLKFTTLWPHVNALAASADHDVMREWAGLGYYARARNLLACARIVSEQYGGVFPDTEQALAALPGIGPYTAGAIAAIAFNRKAAAVDGNVERVISRLHAIETPLPQSKPLIRRLTADLVPEDRPGDFAQALMDLGATICTPRKPKCLLCPWEQACQGRLTKAVEDLPIKQPKKKLPHRKGQVYWVEKADGSVLLEQRHEKRMLGGMLGLPTTAWDKREEGQSPPLDGQYQSMGQVEHSFTHFHLTLDVQVLRLEADTQWPLPDGRWVASDALGQAGLPSLFMKVVKLMRAQEA